MRVAVLNMIGDMPFVTLGMRRLDADAWTRLEMAVIANDEGDRPFAQGVIADLERKLRVTDGDRLAALYGRNVVAGPYSSLKVRPPRQRRPKGAPRRSKAKGAKPQPKAQPQSAGLPEYAPTPERLAQGRFEMEEIVATVYARDKTGEAAHGRRVVMGKQYKDQTTDLKTRLKRFQRFEPDQISAALMFEKDWGDARLEPKLVANLFAIHSASNGEVLADSLIDARNRLQDARNALSGCGVDMLRVVESVVIGGCTSREIGGARYANLEKARVYVTTMLDSGLRLLAVHYSVYRPRKKRA